HGGEGRNEKVVERRALRRSLLEVLSTRLERFVRERFHFLFELIDLAHPRLIAADAPLIGGSKQLAGDGADHSGGSLVGRAYIMPARPDLLPALRNAALFGQI